MASIVQGNTLSQIATPFCCRFRDSGFIELRACYSIERGSECGWKMRATCIETKKYAAISDIWATKWREVFICELLQRSPTRKM